MAYARFLLLILGVECFFLNYPKSIKLRTNLWCKDSTLKDINTNVIPDIKSLRYLRMEDRQQLLYDWANSVDNINFLVLDPGQIKTLLVAVIECEQESSQSSNLLSSILLRLRNDSLLNAETIYSSINAACQRNNGGAAFILLQQAVQQGIRIDSYLANRLIQTLARNRKLNVACDLLEACQKGDLGPETRVEAATYTILLDYAGRIQKKDIVSRCIRLVERSGRMKLNEDTYLSALAIFAYAGDYKSALEVLDLYKKAQSIIQIRAYSLTLSSYLYSSTNRNSTGSTSSLQFNDSSSSLALFQLEHSEEMEAIVSGLIRTGQDTSETIASLILQFFCIRNDLPRADLYLKRLQCKGILPSLGALFEYSRLLTNNQDTRRAASFSAYLQLNGYTRFFASSLGLAGTINVTQRVDRTASVSGAVLEEGIRLLRDELMADKPSKTIFRDQQNVLTAVGESFPYAVRPVKLEWFLTISRICISEKRFDDIIQLFELMYAALPRLDLDCVLVHALVEMMICELPYTIVKPHITKILSLVDSLTPTLYFSQRTKRRNYFAAGSYLEGGTAPTTSRGTEISLIESLGRIPFRPIPDRRPKRNSGDKYRDRSASNDINVDSNMSIDQATLNVTSNDIAVFYRKYAPDLMFLANSRMYRYYPLRGENIAKNDVSTYVNATFLDAVVRDGRYNQRHDRYSSRDREFRDEEDYGDDEDTAVDASASKALEFRGIPLAASWKFYRTASYTLLAETLMELEGARSTLAMEQLQKVLDMNFFPCGSVLRRLLKSILSKQDNRDKIVAYELITRFRFKGFKLDDSILQILVSGLCLIEPPLVDVDKLLKEALADGVVLSTQSQKDILRALFLAGSDEGIERFFEIVFKQAELEDRDLDESLWEHFVNSTITRASKLDSNTASASISSNGSISTHSTGKILLGNSIMPKSTLHLSTIIPDKVLEILLRSKKPAEVKSLVTLLSARSITLTSDQHTMLLRRMIDKDNFEGAAELFEIVIQKLKQVSGQFLSLFATAFKRLSYNSGVIQLTNDNNLMCNETYVGFAIMSDRQNMLLNRITLQLPGSYQDISTKAIMVYFKKAVALKNADAAAALFHSLTNSGEKEGSAAVMVAKLCLEKFRSDLLLRLLDGWKPRRTVLLSFVGTLVASLCLAGHWRIALHFEAVYTGELERATPASLRCAPYTLTLLLLAAAQGNQFLATSRLLNYFHASTQPLTNIASLDGNRNNFRLPIYPSELDLNLALHTFLSVLQKFLFFGLYENQIFASTRLPRTSYILKKFNFSLSNRFINATSNNSTLEADKILVNYSIPDVIRETVVVLNTIRRKNMAIHPRNKDMKLVSDDMLSFDTSHDSNNSLMQLVRRSAKTITALLEQLPVAEAPKCNTFEYLFHDLPLEGKFSSGIDEFDYDTDRLENNLPFVTEPSTLVSTAIGGGNIGSTRYPAVPLSVRSPGRFTPEEREQALGRMEENIYFNALRLEDYALMDYLDIGSSQGDSWKHLKEILNTPPGHSQIFSYTHLQKETASQ